MRIGPFGAAELVVLLITVFVVLAPLILFWRVFSKAGYSGLLSLLLLIPGVGLVVALSILAFGEWPNSTEWSISTEGPNRSTSG